VLQAADILLPKAHIVPVGPDNLAQVEITREIARRFNQTYGEVFVEPAPLLGVERALVGTDGKGKMSKSAGNSILLSDDRKVLEKKIRKMYTDPNRVHADMPGTVEGNPVFEYHRIFNPDQAEVDELAARYAAGTVGDGEVKDRLLTAMVTFMEPLWERRAHYAAQPDLLDDVLWEGTLAMQRLATQTMREVRKALGLGRTMDKLRKRMEKRGRTPT
jgi:tryptophanyl-tRNA synthetase